MKYALTSFALILTLVGGFVFGAYYMYNKYNPAQQEVQEEAPVEASVDDASYYDSDGNWQFRYNEEESGYGGKGTSVSAGGTASENIDYRITGTNFTYEDDGYYSGFHAVVTVENIGTSNLYLGRDSVFNIEDRNLAVVDSYDYVRAVPDVIAPGEKGYFYVPYGQIKTIEDSVTIDENALTGDVLDIGDDATREGSVSGEDENNAVDIDELERALGIGDDEDGENDGTEDDAASDNTSASIRVDAPILMASATESGETSEEITDDKDNKDTDSGSDKASSKDSEEETAEDSDDSDEEASGDDDPEAVEDAEDAEDTGTDTPDAEVEAATEVTDYPGLSLYRVNEYFIMPVLDVEKCADDPRTDYEIDNIVYGSNESGNFALSADVVNNSDQNEDYIPVTVVALDRRGNAIAVGRTALTDFYSGAQRSFGVSYILTREQRSNIVQCVIYARQAVSK